MKKKLKTFGISILLLLVCILVMLAGYWIGNLLPVWACLILALGLMGGGRQGHDY